MSILHSVSKWVAAAVSDERLADTAECPGSYHDDHHDHKDYDDNHDDYNDNHGNQNNDHVNDCQC